MEKSSEACGGWPYRLRKIRIWRRKNDQIIREKQRFENGGRRNNKNRVCGYDAVRGFWPVRLFGRQNDLRKAAARETVRLRQPVRSEAPGIVSAFIQQQEKSIQISLNFWMIMKQSTTMKVVLLQNKELTIS